MLDDVLFFFSRAPRPFFLYPRSTSCLGRPVLPNACDAALGRPTFFFLALAVSRPECGAKKKKEWCTVDRTRAPFLNSPAAGSRAFVPWAGDSDGKRVELSRMVFFEIRIERVDEETWDLLRSITIVVQRMRRLTQRERYLCCFPVSFWEQGAFSQGPWLSGPALRRAHLCSRAPCGNGIQAYGETPQAFFVRTTKHSAFEADRLVPSQIARVRDSKDVETKTSRAQDRRHVSHDLCSAFNRPQHQRIKSKAVVDIFFYCQRPRRYAGSGSTRCARCSTV